MDLTFKPVKRISWASYGSHINSWFFAYEMLDGTSTFQSGKEIPTALRQFMDRIRPVSDLYSSLRVQLGDDDSFVAWTKTSWICQGLPVTLEGELLHLSGAHMRIHNILKGSLNAALTQVTWHRDGSYYVEGKAGYFWHFSSDIASKEWIKLWSRKAAIPTLKELSELAVSSSLYWSIDSHLRMIARCSGPSCTCWRDFRVH